MEDVTTPVLSGTLVLLAGLLAFVLVSNGGHDGSSPEDTIQDSASAAFVYSDLAPEVERALLGAGAAWIYQAEAPAGVPGELARVLDAYQATLMIPTGEAR